MKVIELRIWERNDYGHILIAFGLTVFNFYAVVSKTGNAKNWTLRLGNFWNWKAREWEIGHAS